MPTIPSLQTLQAQTPNILNAIRNDLGGTYADQIPIANDTTESIKAIGQAMMSNAELQNSFLHALTNRIGMVIITSKSYKNPWSMFKKGFLDYGETCEEIFVGMAHAIKYDDADAENTLFKRYKPDVSSAFHRLNFAVIYPTTVSQEQLKRAFLSMSGVTDLLNRITEQLYTAMEYDEFIVMKYLLGRVALDGKVSAINIPAWTTDNLKAITSTIKGATSKLKYMSTLYNMAGVKTHSEIDDIYIILNSQFEADMDVNVLATAFNMDKAEFLGHRVGVDSFGAVDTGRLAELFKTDSAYVPFTADEITALNNLPAIVVDKQFFMIFDVLQEMNDVQNQKGLYWNYFLHVWKTFSISPFANAILFTPTTPSVTSVTITPSTATVTKGAKFALTGAVVTSGFAPQTILWSVNSTDSTIEPNGVLTVSKTESKTTLTVTATSAFNSAKTATATITVV